MAKQDLNKNGTPRKHGNTVCVTFRLDKGVLAEVAQLSAELHVPQSELIRDLVTHAMRDNRRDTSFLKASIRKRDTSDNNNPEIRNLLQEAGESLTRTLTQVSRMGNNINQIAKKVNRGETDISLSAEVEQMQKIRSDYEQLLKTIGSRLSSI